MVGTAERVEHSLLEIVFKGFEGRVVASLSKVVALVSYLSE